MCDCVQEGHTTLSVPALTVEVEYCMAGYCMWHEDDHCLVFIDERQVKIYFT